MSIQESHLAQEAIAALVDGELPAGPANRAAKHLLGCTLCRMAVRAQQEAKEALHRSADVDVPGDLMARLQAIPFTADVPGSGGSLSGGSLSGEGDHLTLTGSRGSFSVPLAPTGGPAVRPHHARWLRRGLVGTVAVLGAGVTALALTLPTGGGTRPGGPAAGPAGTGEHTTILPPVVRTVTVGDAGSLPGYAVDGTP